MRLHFILFLGSVRAVEVTELQCYSIRMISHWFELKDTAISLRRSGMSMTGIEAQLGIPRSTLSGWFKTIPLTSEQKSKLLASKRDGWAKARVKAAESHRAKKTLRLIQAKQDAIAVLDQIELTDATLDLAFAMLYLGEGAKSGSTSLASSDPRILKFVLAVLRNNYAIGSDLVRCELHLRADQDPTVSKAYWAAELAIPIENFRSVSIDQRSAGRTTYEHYKGVCVLYCGPIAIQRKLMYLYALFCDKVVSGINKNTT